MESSITMVVEVVLNTKIDKETAGAFPLLQELMKRERKKAPERRIRSRKIPQPGEIGILIALLNRNVDPQNPLRREEINLDTIWHFRTIGTLAEWIASRSTK